MLMNIIEGRKLPVECCQLSSMLDVQLSTHPLWPRLGFPAAPLWMYGGPANFEAALHPGTNYRKSCHGYERAALCLRSECAPRPCTLLLMGDCNAI
jgi:hypothetical protein